VTTSRETNASAAQLDARAELQELYERSPLRVDERMGNFALYMRGSVLVKLLVINDLYLRIRSIPGAIVEFGSWWGQNLVLFENLRAIYEPFNKTRQVIGFDTFEGYQGFSDQDVEGETFSQGGYSVGLEYREYLQRLLAVHEANNVLGHIRDRHTLIAGDVTRTAPEFFGAHRETTVALAYFDMGLYEPTKAALQAIRPNLIPGSVILLDEYSWPEAKGEVIAFREIFGADGYRIEQSAFTPMRAIVTIG
jgi:Macrocin-O-methyltransferase (TylF)